MVHHYKVNKIRLIVSKLKWKALVVVREKKIYEMSYFLFFTANDWLYLKKNKKKKDGSLLAKENEQMSSSCFRSFTHRLFLRPLSWAYLIQNRMCYMAILGIKVVRLYTSLFGRGKGSHRIQVKKFNIY